jgi:hypothetical protein
VRQKDRLGRSESFLISHISKMMLIEPREVEINSGSLAPISEKEMQAEYKSLMNG